MKINKDYILWENDLCTFEIYKCIYLYNNRSSINYYVHFNKKQCYNLILSILVICLNLRWLKVIDLRGKRLDKK